MTYAATALLLALSSPFAVQVKTVHDGTNAAIAEVAVTVPDRHVVYEKSFHVESEGAEVVVVKKAVAVTEPDPLDAAKKIAVFTNNLTSTWRVFPAKEGMEIDVSLQGCNEKTCFMPETRSFPISFGGQPSVSTNFAAQGNHAAADQTASGTWLHGRKLSTAGGYLGPSEFLAFLDRAEGKEGKTSFLSDPLAFLQKNGIWLTLLLILLGGVLLNFTPCVLPMIPINLAVIGAGTVTAGAKRPGVSGAKDGAGSARRLNGFMLGGAYGFGIVLAYGGAGWAVVRSGAFFGALQSSPWFSLGVAVLFAAFALALFDVFSIDFTKWRRRSRKDAAGSLAGRFAAAFAAGAASAVLAGACVAPVVLAVLLLAGSLYANGAAAAQFLPFVLGLGMALPWPFAGMGLSVLPKPGMWMVWVKRGFGVLLVVLAAYYGVLAAKGFSGKPDAAPNRSGLVAGDKAAWDAALEQADGKPVLVDFWATWCKNCTVMEHRTFRDAKVAERLSGYAVIRVQTEKPDEAREMLDAFGVKGLPAFAVLK